MIKEIFDNISNNKIASALTVALILSALTWGKGKYDGWNAAADVTTKIEQRIGRWNAAAMIQQQILTDLQEHKSELDSIVDEGLTDYDDAYDEFNEWKKQCWNEINKARVRDGLEPIPQP